MTPEDATPLPAADDAAPAFMKVLPHCGIVAVPFMNSTTS